MERAGVHDADTSWAQVCFFSFFLYRFTHDFLQLNRWHTRQFSTKLPQTMHRQGTLVCFFNWILTYLLTKSVSISPSPVLPLNWIHLRLLRINENKRHLLPYPAYLRLPLPPCDRHSKCDHRSLLPSESHIASSIDACSPNSWTAIHHCRWGNRSHSTKHCCHCESHLQAWP